MFNYIVFVVLAMNSLAGIRNRVTPMLLLLMASLIINEDLPVKVLGQDVNTQRLAVILILTFLVLRHSLDKRYQIRRDSLQSVFVIVFSILFTLSVIHFILGNLDGVNNLVSPVLNVLLFVMVYHMLSVSGSHELRRFFERSLPLVFIVILGAACLNHVVGTQVIGHGDGFYAAYRMRGGNDERNIVNVWAASLAIFSPLVTFYLVLNSSIFYRVLSILASIVLAFTIYLTFSRAAAISLLIFYLSAGLYFGFGRFGGASGKNLLVSKRALSTGILLISLISLLLIFWSRIPLVGAFESRYSSLSSDESVSSRLSVYSQVAREFAAAPLIGSGNKKITPTANPSENTLLYIAKYFGLFGLLPYILLLGLVGKRIAGTFNQDARLGGFLFSAFLLYLAVITTNDFLLFSPATLMLAFFSWSSSKNGMKKIISMRR